MGCCRAPHAPPLHPFVLLVLVPGAFAACFKHTSCWQCVSEVFTGGSCFWYTDTSSVHPTWSCLAGMVGDNKPSDDAAALVGSVDWSYTAVDGQVAEFKLLNVDAESMNSCYTTPCLRQAVCALAYYAVENKACVGKGDPAYRQLRCCREQRNTDGYLRGFDVRSGMLQGQLQYSACCVPCNPGQVNIGCSSFNSGQCQPCPTGTFSAFGSTDKKTGSCQACRPCPAGSVRVGCGPSREGRCDPCAENTYKVQGLEGQWSDQCLSCNQGCTGAKLLDCGGSSPGHCGQCRKGQFFASPLCRGCSQCNLDVSSQFYARIAGCGGNMDSTCTGCGQGFFELTGQGTCDRCSTCIANLSSVSLGSLHVSGPPARVGCGGFAAGECVRMAAALGGSVASSLFKNAPRCATSRATVPGNLASVVFCPGDIIPVQWAIQGHGSEAPRLASGGGDCSGAGGACLAGVWQAVLWRRTAQNPLGEAMGNLGNWSLQQLPAVASGDLHVKSAQLAPLPASLPGSSGYFVRVSFEDYGSTCCAGISSSTLFADTADFEVADVAEAVANDEEKAALELMAATPDTSAAVVLLEIACGSSQEATGIGGPAAEAAMRVACERAKALQFGMVVGDLGLMPLPLPAYAVTTMRKAIRTAEPVTTARSGLAAWDDLTNRSLHEIPSDSMAWSSMTSSSDNTSVVKIMMLADEASAAANATRDMWQADVTSSANQLSRTLKELKELDGLVLQSTDALGFGVVRMVQGTVSFLWDSLIGGPSLDGKTLVQWYSTALNMIGSIAVMLTGTWREDWRHDIEWQIAAEVGTVGTSSSSHIFGGASRSSGAVPLAEASSRVWMTFRKVADAWLARLETDVHARRLASNSSTTQRHATTNGATSTTRMPAGPASTSTTYTSTTAAPGLTTTATLPPQSTVPPPPPPSNTEMAQIQAQGRVIGDIVTCVELVTEQVLEPLSRAGSLLLVGPLPNITACGQRGNLLHQFVLGTIGTFSTAVDVAMFGIGAKAYRPWMDTTSETQRLKRAAGEVVTALYGRMNVFRTFLLQLLELRDISAELARMTIASAHALAAASHLSWLSSLIATSATVGPSSPQAAWHWQDTCLRILQVVRHGRTSAARLSRRSLGRLQSLVVWVGGELVSSESQWTPAQSASQLEVVEMSTIRALARALDAADVTGATTGFLRIEGNADSWPLVFASLEKTGTTILNLQAPIGAATRRHREVYAYLLSPDSEELQYPLLTVDRPDKPARSPLSDAHGINVPYVELTLRHLVNGVGEPVQSSVPMYTRHQRHECMPLGVDMAPQASAALEPLHGMWVLSASDGASHNQLILDPGTSLRIYIKLDHPGGAPPWEILRGPPSLLYNSGSSTGECNALPVEFTMRVTTSTTTLLTGKAPNATGTQGPQLPGYNQTTSSMFLQQGFLVPGVGQPTTAPEPGTDLSVLTWVIPILGVILLGACMCVACNRQNDLLFRKCPWLARFRKSKVSSNVEVMEKPSPIREDDLRQCIPSPKNAVPALQNPFAKAPLLPLGFAPPVIPAKKLPIAGSPIKEAPPEDWGPTTDTPRNNESSSDSEDTSSSSGSSYDSTDGDPSTARSQKQKATSQPTGTVIGSAGFGRGPLSQHFQGHSALANPAGSPPPPDLSLPPRRVAGDPSSSTSSPAKPSTANASTNGGLDEASSRTSPSSGDSRQQLIGSQQQQPPPQPGAPPLQQSQDIPLVVPSPPVRPPSNLSPPDAPQSNGLRQAAFGAAREQSMESLPDPEGTDVW